MEQASGAQLNRAETERGLLPPPVLNYIYTNDDIDGKEE